MLDSLLKKIFGTKHDREMKRLRPMVEAINGLEAKVRELDDAALRKKTFDLKLPDFASGRHRDVLFFTQELSILLNSGVPLDRALTIAGEHTERPGFRAVILDVLRVLKGGKSFADSLATHPRHFGDLYVNMVRAGEASGALAIVFDRLSDFER